MKFNVDKCKVVHYGKSSIGFKYSLYGQPIAESTEEKDLGVGVVFSSDLKVGTQCREAYSKASQALGSSTQSYQVQESFSTLNLSTSPW